MRDASETKPTALERLLALSEDDRIDALVVACEPALVAWTTWALRAKPSYFDGVVGMHHVVDADLPARALDEVRRRHERPDPASTIHAFIEPIVALQDGDFELDDRLQYAFYAIYNLHRIVFEPNDTVTPLLVLNQAISSTVTDDEESVERRLAEWWLAWERLS